MWKSTFDLFTKSVDPNNFLPPPTRNNTDNMTDIDFSRAKRSVDDLFHVDAITMIEAANLSAITTITTTTTTATLATTPKTEAQEWSYSTNVTELYAIISELEHFTFYTIEVRACQTHSKNENKSDCSVTAITSVRTLPLRKYCSSFW